MQTLSKAVRRSGNAGEPLPTVYRAFDASRIHFRRSATSMLAGWPGAFKSALALNMMAHWAKHGLNGLYFSADADPFTVGKRTAAILSGYPIDAVEAGLRSGMDFYDKVLTDVSTIRFVFKAADIDDIDRHMRAFEAVYGDFPDMVWIDNLMNMVQSDNEWTAMRNMTLDLDTLARESKSHVQILHHVSESIGQPGVPPPRYAIQGKVNQFPRLILTLGADGGVLNIACVKNTNGPQDPTGKTMIPFTVAASTMRIQEAWAFEQMQIDKTRLEVVK